MRLLPILYRLCWKEFRQGWLILALGLLLPPLTVNLQQNDFWSDWGIWHWSWMLQLNRNLPAITLFMLLLGVSVWAARLGAEACARQSYAGVHFPQHPALASYLTFFWQGSAAALIGLSIGYARMHMVYDDEFFAISLWAMLYLASTFMVSFIMASALTQWSGIVAGLIWALGNGQTFTALSEYWPNIDKLSMQIMGGTIVMSCIAMLILQSHTTLRLGFNVPRVLAPLLLGMAMLSVPFCWLAEEIRLESRLDKHMPINYPVRLTSADDALAIECDRLALKKDAADLHVIDYRRQRTLTQHFAQDIQPIGFVGQSAVLLRQQRRHEHHLTLLRWALDTNTVATFASIPDNPDQTAEGCWDASMSRDGHYALLYVPSPYGNYFHGFVDLWKIDNQLRKATLLQPDFNCGIQIGWRGNDALVSCRDSVLSLSMTTGQMTPTQLPTPREGK